MKQFAAQLVLALECLHRNGQVYGDLTPKTVEVDRRGFLSLANFASKSLRKLRGFRPRWAKEYEAPEKFWPLFHDESGTAADWYSLGVIM